MNDKYGPMKNPVPYMLKTDPDFRKLHQKLKEEGFYIHSMCRPVPEWDDLTENERQKGYWYLPICSLKEVERVVSPKNLSDYLLYLRAESIVTNMRILRTMHDRAGKVPFDDWELTNQFDDSIFDEFKASVDSSYQEAVKPYVCGTIFSDDPNASCSATKFGILIVISEALKIFLYFMNLGYYEVWNFEKEEIPLLVKRDALLIALRTMLLIEAFDFELDPRGKIPKTIHRRLTDISNAQIGFVIGHEFGHILESHLKEGSLYKRLPSYFRKENPKHGKFLLNLYSKSEKQEFEADSKAIDIIAGDSIERRRSVLLNAILVFCFFELFEIVYKSITGDHDGSGTHPPANKRRLEMINLGSTFWTSHDVEIIDSIIKLTEECKSAITELLHDNPKLFSFYGSLYLGPWRMKKKIDRIDY
jgi:hypothetical protein